MQFELLVLVETVLCVWLAVGALRSMWDGGPAPELDLGQQAWVAGRFAIAEARPIS